MPTVIRRGIRGDVFVPSALKQLHPRWQALDLESKEAIYAARYREWFCLINSQTSKEFQSAVSPDDWETFPLTETYLIILAV